MADKELSGIDYTPEYEVQATGEKFTGKTQDAVLAREDTKRKYEIYKKIAGQLAFAH